MADEHESFDENAHFAAVGRITSLWAEFELQIDAAAIKLAKVAMAPGLCLTSQIMGASRKLDAYLALAELRGSQSPAWKSLNAALNRFYLASVTL
jgi:hypothetical protein